MRDKAYPPLVIDPDRMLAVPVCLQSFKPIARGNTQIGEYPSLVQKTKLPQRDILNIGRKSSAPPAGPDQLCFRIGEALSLVRL
jgi:hypothetical protein